RRYLYALLAMVVTIPLLPFLNFQQHVATSRQTKALYEAIEALPENSFVLFGSDWGGGTAGESQPQGGGLMRHLMKKKLRFAILFLQGPSQVPMGLAPTAVMSPEAFNYLDSGQLVGMAAGLQGAIEYEQLVGVVGQATKRGNASSFAHLLIITLLFLGNLAMI